MGAKMRFQRLLCEGKDALHQAVAPLVQQLMKEDRTRKCHAGRNDVTSRTQELVQRLEKFCDALPIPGRSPDPRQRMV